MGQPPMMVRVQAGGGAASYDGTCAGWGSYHGCLDSTMTLNLASASLALYTLHHKL